MDTRKLDFVIQQLASYSGVKRKVGDTTFILGPFHAERTPSCRVFHKATSRDPGSCKCFGCGKTASWDEIAPKIGLSTYVWTKPRPVYAAPRETVVEAGRDTEYDLRPIPSHKMWRGIRTNLLRALGAKMYTTTWGDKFIWLPVYIRGELMGYIRARFRKVADKPSYLNKAGHWSEKHGLFPYDFAIRKQPNVVVLVEGPRDALRLVQEGVPAIAILGTQSWSDQKSRHLELTGAKTVVLMMDGDDAGAKAEELIEPSLSRMVNVVKFDLRGADSPYFKYTDEDEPSKAAKAAGVELWDPGNCPDRKIRELKKLIRTLA